MGDKTKNIHGNFEVIENTAYVLVNKKGLFFEIKLNG